MRTILIALFFLVSSTTLASSLDISEESISKVSSKEQWRHLLHYHQAGLFSRYESQVDDPKFFMADNGAQDPHAELVATIDAFAEKPEIQCQFPARAYWIKQELPDLQFESVVCTEYDEWAQKIDAENLTLIFPAAYLNSPSSMYGHTLIRIDRRSGKNPLLDYSINYAANADPNDNELKFSYKGLTGGYPGVFSVLPYYEKVNEYSYLEARDVWEYKLDIDPDELAQFLRHTWEIKDAHFDYYFFTENCSYHLLTILDAASERFDLSDEFYASAIPADTVRVINEAGLIKTATFRPSKLSLMLHQKKQLNEDQIQTAKDIVENQAPIQSSLERYNTEQQSQILELAYQYSRFLSVKKKKISKQRNNQAIKLLSARSKLPVSEQIVPFPDPSTRDDEGHHSRRAQFLIGEQKQTSFAELGLRMAYHDFLDPIPGYLKGAKLEMFHLKARTNLEDDKMTRAEKIGLIDISSFSPINELVQPISWRVSTGFERYAPIDSELMPYLSTGFGYSMDYMNHLFYGLANFEANLDTDIDKGYRTDLGPRVGWLYQKDLLSINLEFNRYYNIGGEDFDLNSTSLGLGVNLNKNMQVRVESSYSEYHMVTTNKAEYDNTNAISFLLYF